jgi:hypothetical protein
MTCRSCLHSVDTMGVLQHPEKVAVRLWCNRFNRLAYKRCVAFCYEPGTDED